MTDVEDRVILGLKEQGEVGGKMVVYKDFTVERLCSQYFGQLYQAENIFRREVGGYLSYV